MQPKNPSKRPSKSRRRRNRNKKSQQLTNASQKTNKSVPQTQVKTAKQPCPKAIVTPIVSKLEDGWFDDKKADHFIPAKIKVSLTETTSGRASTTYTGSGTVAVGGLRIYTNAGCTAELTTKVSNQDLRNGKDLYVKGTAVANKTATLTLDPASDPSKVTVRGPASASVPFKKVNVITPKIVLESKVVLLNHTPVVDGKETSVCWVKLSLGQTNKAHKLNSLKSKLVYGAEVECFKDEDCTQALASRSELTYQELTANLPKKLYLRGETAGEFKISLEPTEPENLEKSYRIEAKKEETLAVVKIDVEVYAWAEARQYPQNNDGTYIKNADGKAQEGRELQYQDTAAFKRAKIVVKKPNDLLWTHGSDQAKITLTPYIVGNTRMHFYTSSGGNTQVTELAKGDLGADKTLWLEATGTTNLDNDPGYRFQGWAARLPEKEVKNCCVQFGAKVKSPYNNSMVELKNGDGSRIKTFSFDRSLDRLARNASHRKIRNDRRSELDYYNVVLAYSGLHQSYGGFFGGFCNLNYDSRRVPIFNRFKEAIRRRDNRDSRASRAQRGANFVESRLRGHGITLHSVTKTMIQRYILGELNANRVLSARNGVPGVHGEVLAVNAALRYLAANNENPALNNNTLGAITVATYKLSTQGNLAQGKRFHACDNCWGILNRNNLRILTG